MNQESNLQNNNEQTIQNTETPVAQTQNIYILFSNKRKNFI